MSKKLSSVELDARLKTAREVCLSDPHIKWKHYKGGIYQMVDVAINSDTVDVDVIYRRVDGPDYDPFVENVIQFTRPLKEFENTEKWTRVRRQLVSEWVPISE